jgi:subtilisin-like proprotein convertase family protein
VDPVPGLQGKVLTGGVLDAARAVGYNTSPPTSPTPPSTLQVVSSTVSGTAAGTFDTIQVTFNQALNASVFTNTDVALIGPNGQRITIQSFQSVSGTGGTQFNFTFAPQSTSGTYTLYIGAGILSVAGVPLASTYSNTFQLANAVTFSSTAPVGVPDVSQTTALLSVPQSLTIGRVTVNVNMANSIDGKIVLMLIAPDGTQVLLSNQEGGNGQSFSSTVFDDTAGAPIGSGQAPFTGSFRPESPLAALSGKNAQGTWKLLIVDHGTNYHVVLTSWSLTFSSAGASAAKTASVSIPELETGADAALANNLAGVRQTTGFDTGFVTAGFGARLTNILSAATRAAANFFLPSASAPAQPNGTTLSDDIFASVDGVDRLAELRVAVAHGDRGDSTVADEDESAGSANVVDAADVAFLDF